MKKKQFALHNLIFCVYVHKISRGEYESTEKSQCFRKY